MSWLASLLAILLYFKRKSLAKIIKRKDSSPGKKRKNTAIISHYELLDRLQENIGQEVMIQSKNQAHLYENQLTNTNRDFKGKIIAVDDIWIKLELNASSFPMDRRPDYLYMRTEMIANFYPVD